jgi:hypothetical protein
VLIRILVTSHRHSTYHRARVEDQVQSCLSICTLFTATHSLNIAGACCDSLPDPQLDRRGGRHLDDGRVADKELRRILVPQPALHSRGHRFIGKRRDDQRGVDITSAAIAIPHQWQQICRAFTGWRHDCRRSIFLTASGVFLYAPSSR